MRHVPYYTDLLGKGFAYGGRGPDSFDCYGLAIELYRRAGLALPEYVSSDRHDVQSAGFESGATAYFDQQQQPQELDIVLFQVVPKYVTHCGIYVGHGRFVHITEHHSVTVEELASPLWQHRQRGFYRFKGLLNG